MCAPTPDTDRQLTQYRDMCAPTPDTDRQLTQYTNGPQRNETVN